MKIRPAGAVNRFGALLGSMFLELPFGWRLTEYLGTR
jgi:hypothetical protein